MTPTSSSTAAGSCSTSRMGATRGPISLPTLHGSYEAFAGLGSEALLTTAGGVPAGYYDAQGGVYWTYVHAHESGATVVRRAVHADFLAPLPSADFATVVDASDLGLSADTGVESPSFFDRQSEPSVPLPGVQPPGLSLLAALVALAGLRRFRGRDVGTRFRPTPVR